MAEEDERRESGKRAGRRDPARNARRDPPVIEGQAENVTPPVDPVAASGDMMEAPAVEAEHPNAVRPDVAVTEAETQTVAAATSEPQKDIHSVDEPRAAPFPDPEPAAPSTAQPASTTGRSGSRWGTLAALGFIILAAGILYLFSQLSSLPPDNSAAVASLRAQVASLQARPATDASGLADRVEKAEQTATATQTGLDALSKRVDGIATAVSNQPNVTQQIADLQAAIGTVKSDIADVKASVAALPKPDIGRIESRIGDLDQRIAGLQGVVSGIPHIDLGPITGKVDSLEARLKPVEADVAQARSPEVAAQRRAAPVAVTAQAITDAIESGAPFQKEFQALQALGVDAAALGPLQAVASSGAPSLRDLQSSLSEMRDRIVASGTTPETGSYMDRLVAGASNLVQVKPVGSVVGDTPSAIVARMNDEIGNDDLAAALADWHKLPEAARTASKSLADRLTQRLDALKAAREIATNAIASMAAPRG